MPRTCILRRKAFTGEISPAMLSDLCQYVILGHSEWRRYFGETDELINQKVRAAIKFGLVPILCIGETLEQKELEKTRETVNQQVRVALQGITPCGSLVIAYEPVWAIGTGRAATAAEANDTIRFVRNVAAELWGDGVANEVPILYGGSTNAENISDFIAQGDIDGALVGGASLKSHEFISIIGQTAQAKG